jgi:hypothetical protein
VAWIDSAWGGRAASLGTTAAALAVLPLVAWLLRDRPRDLDVAPYGGTPADDLEPVRAGAARAAVRCGDWRWPHGHGRSGCWRPASSSAACRPTGWCSRTSSRLPTTTGCR